MEVDELRMQLMQAVVDVVDRLDDRGIPLEIPDPPLIVQCIMGLPLGRVFIGNNGAELTGAELIGGDDV